MSSTPFETLLPARALGRGRGLVAWFWGILGAIALCGVLVSTALLLDHLGRPEAARRIEAAVTADLAARGAASRTTDEVDELVGHVSTIVADT